MAISANAKTLISENRARHAAELAAGADRADLTDAARERYNDALVDPALGPDDHLALYVALIEIGTDVELDDERIEHICG
jgi:hypothetical protein